MKSVKLTIDNPEYVQEVRDLRRLLDAANDAETPWIQEWYQDAVHDSTRSVGWNFRKELAKALCTAATCEEELGEAVEDDVLKLGFESE